MSRAGFTLVEVCVALVLLSLAALLFAAAAGGAAASSRSAALREGAIARAEQLVDSLLAGPWSGAGEAVDGPYLVRWSGPDAGAEVAVSYSEAGAQRSLVVQLSSPAALPRLDALIRPWP